MERPPCCPIVECYVRPVAVLGAPRGPVIGGLLSHCATNGCKASQPASQPGPGRSGVAHQRNTGTSARPAMLPRSSRLPGSVASIQPVPVVRWRATPDRHGPRGAQRLSATSCLARLAPCVKQLQLTCPRPPRRTTVALPAPREALPFPTHAFSLALFWHHLPAAAAGCPHSAQP